MTSVPPPPPLSPPPADPVPPSTPGDERTWAMLCHLAALATFVMPSAGNIVGPLIVWLIKKDQMPLVDRNGKEALNFQITISLATWAAALCAMCVFCFPPMMCIPLGLAGSIHFLGLIFAVVAAIKTSNGETYSYPFKLTLFK